MSSEQRVTPELVDYLLSLPTQEQRSVFLRHAGLLNAGGLERLLDAADGLLNDDPGKAQKLAEICAGMAGETDAPAIVPRATYIRAGAHGINGEFHEEIRLTRAAHDGYAALGRELEALRTNAGLMSALLELGRYQEALDAGQAVLDAFRDPSKTTTETTTRARRPHPLAWSVTHRNRLETREVSRREASRYSRRLQPGW